MALNQDSRPQVHHALSGTPVMLNIFILHVEILPFLFVQSFECLQKDVILP